MVASQSRKHRGYRTQKVFAEHLRDIFPHAEPTGAGRQGADILGTVGVHFELKARTNLDPKAGLRQAHAEAGDDLPILVTRLNGQGEQSIGEWVAFMRVDTLKQLLREAGYASEGPKE